MQYIENKTFDEIAIGDEAELYREVGDNGGDALIRAVLLDQLPGPGTTRLCQTLTFHAPRKPGEGMTARVIVRDKDAKTRSVTFDCLCLDEQGKTLISGEATVVAPDSRQRQPRAVPNTAQSPKDGGPGQGFARLIAATEALDPIVTAVVHPCDAASLGGALEARERALIEPILIGPKARILAAAQEIGTDLSDVAVVDALHSHAAAEAAVELVRAGKAEALMKGALHTDEIMGAAVDKATGLRTERRMSHVFVLDVPSYPKPLLITDAAINIFPDLETKADIAQNAIDLGHALGIATPRVAVLSAVETVYPKIPSTVEAAGLCKMADRGQITGGLLDGPLAFDNAISKAAAQAKGIVSDVAGEADILLAPDLEAGNMIAKQLQYLAGADSTGIVLGARVPIMLTSRADGVLARVASAALAQLFVRHKQGKGTP